MRARLAAIFLLLFYYPEAQTGTFTDPRDGEVYKTIPIGNRTWFREHLRYKTELSFYKPGISYGEMPGNGNYYALKELKTVCPAGWHVATLDEIEEYIRIVAFQQGIQDTAILRSYSKDKDSSMMITLPKFNPMNDTLLNLVITNWVEGNSIRSNKGVALWIYNNRNGDDKFHAHIGAIGYTIHTHLHNIIDKPRKVRRFAVRCVCDQKSP